MTEIKQFSLDICKEGAIQTIQNAYNESKQNRYEFLTPEVLLYTIVKQPEFIKFCEYQGKDHKELADELATYNDMQDRIAEDEEYVGTTSDMMNKLLDIIADNYNYMAKKLPKLTKLGKVSDPDVIKIDTPDIVLSMADLDEDCIATHLLTKYFGDFLLSWAPLLKTVYMGIKLPPKDTTRSLFNSIKQLTKIFDGMNGKGNSIRIAIPIEEDEDEENDAANTNTSDNHEPWEKLLTEISPWDGVHTIGREKEMERCMRVLCRLDKGNPILVGEPGVGKSAITRGVAYWMITNMAPESLRNSKVYAMDMASLVAGTAMHGEFEKRLKMILEGVSRKTKCILCIDNIHTICDVNGGNNATSAAEIMKPYLQSSRVKVIGCTTYKEYNKTIGNNKSIQRLFELIDVKEPSIEEAVDIIYQNRFRYQIHHHVTYTEKAIRYAVEQAAALIHDRFLPDKAFDLIDEAGAYRQKNPRINKKGEKMAERYQLVNEDTIRTVLTEVCRIDANALATNDQKGLKDLDKRMGNEIYGQDDAIRQVVRSVMMSKAGLTDPEKPIASLLFVGPTGVGKTEICKVLAKEMGIELVRFDMSEYTEKHTISKLIGSPAGYVGYDEGGLLTDAIRKTPNCVLLLDEIEKAHPDIYNVLLQVMDYAKLTDNKGNKSDFRNVILVMTSNAGAQQAAQGTIGFGTGMSKGQSMLNSVKKTFKPEFLNRLTATVTFNDMDRTMASRILDKKLLQIGKRLEPKKVTLELTPEAHEYLLSKGYNPQYGGREIDRALQQHLTPLLMDQILFGKLTRGGNAKVTLKDDCLTIE